MAAQILVVGAPCRTLKHWNYNTNLIQLQISTINQHQRPAAATAYLRNKNRQGIQIRGDILLRSSALKSSNIKIIAYRQVRKWRIDPAEMSLEALSLGWKVMNSSIQANRVWPRTQTWDILRWCKIITQSTTIAYYQPINALISSQEQRRSID